MKWNEIEKILISGIKIVSTLLISGAIALEVWELTVHSLPPVFDWVIFIARFALISHFIEAIAAVFFARRRGINLFKAGIYTLFVGTVGLLEIIGGDRANWLPTSES